MDSILFLLERAIPTALNGKVRMKLKLWNWQDMI
jgi:hypothetical protein